MRELRSYVVRIYRETATGLVGTVQEARSGRTVPFQTMDELWAALRRTSSPSARRTSKPLAKTPASDQADPAGRGTSRDHQEES